MRLAALILLLLPALALAQPQFGFEGESLAFSLTRKVEEPGCYLWSVSGDYYLSNLRGEALSRQIWFPAPASEQASIAELHELRLIEPGDSMAVELNRQTADGFGFALSLPRRSFAQVHIVYSQVLSGAEARYVLLTANRWGRPLPTCEISLFVEAGLELAELPFPEADVSTDESGSYLHWLFTDFSPQSDFILRFKDEK